MDENKIFLKWDEYEKIIDDIVKDIKAKFPNYENIQFIAIARGGLTILNSIVYRLNTRNIGVIQVSMSDDNCNYNTNNIPILMGEFYKEGMNDCILIDDLLFSGKSAEFAANHLKDINKNVLGIYTLYICEELQNEYFKNENIYLYAPKTSSKDAWIVFPWDI